MKKAKLLPLIICGLPAIAGLFLLMLSFDGVIDGYHSSQWQKVSGQIIDGYKRKNMIGFTTFAYHRYDAFAYKYEINGIEFVGHKVSFGVKAPNKEYDSGERVNVYYDPQNPGDSVLIPGVDSSQFVSLFIGGGLLVIGFVLWKRIQI